MGRSRRLAAFFPSELRIPAAVVGLILGSQALRRFPPWSRRPLKAHSYVQAQPLEGSDSASGLENVNEGVDVNTLGLTVSGDTAHAEQLPPPLPELLLEYHAGCSLEKLFRVIMAPERAFISAQNAAHRYRDVHIDSWETDPPGGLSKRCIRFTTPLSNKLGPDHAVCYAQYTLVSRTAQSFHVSMEARTPEVPYGGSFYQDIRFVGVSRGPYACDLTVSAEVKFTKWVPGIASLIRSSAKQGMRDTYATWPACIQVALDQGPDASDSMRPSATATSPTTVPAGKGKLCEGRSRAGIARRVPKNRSACGHVKRAHHLKWRILVLALKVWLLLVSLAALRMALRVAVLSGRKAPPPKQNCIDC